MQAIGLAAFHPCATAEVTRHASPARAGFMLGLFRATTASSLLVGPALAMEMVNAAGFSACFGALAVVAAAGLVAGFGSQGATVCVLALIASDANEALRSTSLALQQNAIDVGIAVSSLLFGALLSALPAPAVFCGWAAALGILVVAGMVCSRR